MLQYCLFQARKLKSNKCVCTFMAKIQIRPYLSHSSKKIGYWNFGIHIFENLTKYTSFNQRNDMKLNWLLCHQMLYINSVGMHVLVINIELTMVMMIFTQKILYYSLPAEYWVYVSHILIEIEQIDSSSSIKSSQKFSYHPSFI